MSLSTCGVHEFCRKKFNKTNTGYWKGVFTELISYISVSDPDPYQEAFIWIRVAPKDYSGKSLYFLKFLIFCYISPGFGIHNKYSL